MSVKYYSFFLLIFALIIWELFCHTSSVSSLIIPAPTEVFLVLWDGLTTGYLWIHIWATTVEMIIGLLIGCSVGFLFGVLLEENKFLRNLLWPYIIASQVIPKLALGPIFIIWFGFGMTSTAVSYTHLRAHETFTDLV